MHTFLTMLLYIVLNVACVPVAEKPCITGCFKPKIEQHSSLYYRRVQLIKRDILDQLGLEEPPKINNNSSKIPNVVLNGLNRYLSDYADPDSDEAEHEEKLKTIVIPAEIERVESCGTSDITCINFSFISQETFREDILHVGLWIHIAQITKRSLITFYDRHNAPESILLKSRIRTSQPGWVGLILQDKHKWLLQTSKGHLTVKLGLKVKCKNCKIEFTHGKQPYLDITEKLIIKRRHRRNIKCTKQSTTCCLDNFYVNFKEIGWDNWIRHPVGFNAQQCRGRCDQGHQHNQAHGGMVRVIAAKQNLTDSIKLCCTTQRYAPLKIVYQDIEGNAIHQALTNIIATQCGCG